MGRNEKPPYFQFYPDDFLSDGNVEAMTTLEVGAYIRLLCQAWRQDPPGTIPNNDRVLAAWARLTTDQWVDCKERVLSAFVLSEDARWHQKRMKMEFQKLRTLSRARSKGAQLALKNRWGDKSAISELLVSNSSPLAYKNEDIRIKKEEELNINISPSKNRPAKPKKKPPPDGGLSERDFNSFWLRYPRKVGKDAARKALARRGPELLAAIMSGLESQRDEMIEKIKEGDGRFVPHPATWLNEGRWADEESTCESGPPPMTEAQGREIYFLIRRKKGMNEEDIELDYQRDMALAEEMRGGEK